MTSLPKTDSICELAKFWDAHDVTDFDGDLQEVTEAVFARSEDLAIHLSPADAQALHALAAKRRVSGSELVSAWVHERVQTQIGKQIGNRFRLSEESN